jgi:hypothetical protein
MAVKKTRSWFASDTGCNLFKFRETVALSVWTTLQDGRFGVPIPAPAGDFSFLRDRTFVTATIWEIYFS